MKHLLVLIGFLSLHAGCMSAHFIPTNAPPRPLAQRDPAAIELFMSMRPNRQIVEIGFIETQDQTGFGDREAFQELRVQAAAHGCDGIILLGSNDGIRVNRGNVTTLTGYRATCFVYTDDKPPAAPADDGVQRI